MFYTQVDACKRNMNTFAFVGDLEKSPEVGVQPVQTAFACCARCLIQLHSALLCQISLVMLQVSCVYHSEAAENQFLQNPRKSVLGDGYQARTPQALSAPGLDAAQ